MVGVEVPVMAVRHQIVTFPTIAEGAAHPFPLFFLVGKGYYARPEEQGALLGMSNASDEADLSERYQIDFDWGYFEKTRPDWESAYPPLKGLPISRAWAASIDYTPDHLPIIDEPMEGFYVLAAGGAWHDVGTGAGREDGGFDLRGRAERRAEGGRGARRGSRAGRIQTGWRT